MIRSLMLSPEVGYFFRHCRGTVLLPEAAQAEQVTRKNRAA